MAPPTMAPTCEVELDILEAAELTVAAGLTTRVDAYTTVTTWPFEVELNASLDVSQRYINAETHTTVFDMTEVTGVLVAAVVCASVGVPASVERIGAVVGSFVGDVPTTGGGVDDCTVPGPFEGGVLVVSPPPPPVPPPALPPPGLPPPGLPPPGGVPPPPGEGGDGPTAGGPVEYRSYQH
jgi:hypothetical protein